MQGQRSVRKSPISPGVCAVPVIYSALNNEHNEQDGAGEGQRQRGAQTTETSDWSSGRRDESDNLIGCKSGGGNGKPYG